MNILSCVFRSTRVDADYHVHVNPDGKSGGLVASEAKVDPSAHVARFAVVQPGATVAAGQRIRAGDIILSSGDTLRFD